MRTTVYVEGHKDLRKGFKMFIDRYFDRMTRIKVIACKAEPIREFCLGLRSRPDDHHILPMDADVLDQPFRQSVRNREDWARNCIVKTDDHDLHFMVQNMEAWFICDQDCLREFFGQGFNARAIPKGKLETKSKDQLEGFIKKATKNTQKNLYSKSKHAPRILEQLNPHLVAEKMTYAKSFFDRLSVLSKTF